MACDAVHTCVRAFTALLHNLDKEAFYSTLQTPPIPTLKPLDAVQTLVMQAAAGLSKTQKPTLNTYLRLFVGSSMSPASDPVGNWPQRLWRSPPCAGLCSSNMECEPS